MRFKLALTAAGLINKAYILKHDCLRVAFNKMSHLTKQKTKPVSWQRSLTVFTVSYQGFKLWVDQIYHTIAKSVS